jgi:predicted metal-dependent peptidase
MTFVTNKKITAPESFIGEFDAALDAKAREKLITARVGLLIRASFFGNLVTRMKLINADTTIETIATDGRNFYYNSRFVNFLTQGELEFGFAHEILHCIYDHFDRREDRDPKLSNIAADYCVNADLKKHNIGTFITSVPCLYNEKYIGWSFEKVYDDLYESMDKINVDQLMDQLLDEHLEISDDANGTDDSDNDGHGKKPTISRSEMNEIKNELKEAILTAHQTSNDVGDLPDGIQRVIKELTEPKLNWRELLRSHLESTIKSDFSWSRPSRKGWHTDAILPGVIGDDLINIAIAIDTSGSVDTKMLKDFLSEVAGITETFPAFNIHLFTFDTEVYNPTTFDNDSIVDITEYQIYGGGGTDFRVIFKYLKEHDIVPDRLVIFTDLDCYSYGDANYAETLWIAFDRGYKAPDAPFGQTVRYTEK